MTDETKKEINEGFQQGASPIGLANHYNTTVNQIYEIIGQPEMNKVTFAGDQVDQSEVMPGTPLTQFHQQDVTYSKD